MAELTVVVPTFNDASSIEAMLKGLHEVVVASGTSVEVLIVDDGSVDDTREVAARFGDAHPTLHLRVLLIRKQHFGFGSLVRYGLAYASGRYCALMSADGSDPVTLLPTMLQKLRGGAQLVICSRYAEGDPSTVDRRYRIYQRLYRAAIRILLGTEITDSTYGFRAFDRKYVQALGLSSNRFNVCPEMTFKVLLSDGRTDYVPGSPESGPGDGSEKFKLPNEVIGYAHVLARAALHRAGVVWF